MVEGCPYIETTVISAKKDSFFVATAIAKCGRKDCRQKPVTETRENVNKDTAERMATNGVLHIVESVRSVLCQETLDREDKSPRSKN